MSTVGAAIKRGSRNTLSLILDLGQLKLGPHVDYRSAIISPIG